MLRNRTITIHTNSTHTNEIVSELEGLYDCVTISNIAVSNDTVNISLGDSTSNNFIETDFKMLTNDIGRVVRYVDALAKITLIETKDL